MDRKNNKANQAAYLKVSKTKKKKSMHFSGKARNTVILEKDGIPTKKEFIDISLSCDYIFQYLFENRCINKRYFRIYFITFYLTLVMINLLTISFISYTREPSIAYQFTCFNPKTFSYEKCAYRTWCYCEDLDNCFYSCYDNAENCLTEFIQKNSKVNDKINISTSYSNQIFVRFITNNSNINIFDKISQQYCYIKFIILVIMTAFYIGGGIGSIIFGFLSDRFGKKIIILSQCLILNVSLIFISVYSNRKFDEYDSLTYFLCIWAGNGFILGFCLFSMEHLVYLQFIESFEDVNYLTTINGIFHSYFAFSGVLLVFFNNILQNLSYLFYLSVLYFFGFYFFYMFYFVENQRFFSERKENVNKKTSFERILIKVLVVKKKENGEEEKYWKNIVFYDSRRQRVVNDEIKDKVIQVNEEEVDFYVAQTRNKTNKYVRNSRLRNQSNVSNFYEPDGLTNNKDDIKTNSKNNLKNLAARKLSDNTVKKMNLKDYSVNDEITFKDIYNKYKEDNYLNQYYYIFLIGWMAITYCMYGSSISFLMDLTNPSKSEKTQSLGIYLYSFVMYFFSPIIVGKFSFYFSHVKLILICLFIFSIISFILDSYKLYPDVDRISFYGSSEQVASLTGNNLIYNKSTAVYFITTVYSLFELLSINSAPTLYRTLFLSSCKSISKFSALLAYFTVFVVDTSGMNFGMVAAFICLIFLWVDIKLKDLKLLEYTDSEHEENKRKISEKQKVIKQIINSNDDGRKTRTNSIFTRLRNFSIKRLNKQQ